MGMFDMIAGRDPLQKFQRSFDHFDMSIDFMQDLYNYVIMGFDPGSFFTAIFANDFVGACHRSHPCNSWSDIRETGKWLTFEAPEQCWGSYEKVEAWLKLDNETRTKICEDKGLIATAWDILKEPA